MIGHGIDWQSPVVTDGGWSESHSDPLADFEEMIARMAYPRSALLARASRLPTLAQFKALLDEPPPRAVKVFDGPVSPDFNASASTMMLPDGRVYPVGVEVRDDGVYILLASDAAAAFDKAQNASEFRASCAGYDAYDMTYGQELLGLIRQRSHVYVSPFFVSSAARRAADKHRAGRSDGKRAQRWMRKPWASNEGKR